MPSVLSYTNAFLGIPYPQKGSGKATVTSYLYPGAVQPQKQSLSVLSYTNALLGIPFPQKGSGKSSVTSFLFPGAIQPQPLSVTPPSFDVAGWAEVEWG